jgi:hypothetical protein
MSHPEFEEPKPQPWWKTEPKLVSKNDLCEIPLKVFVDRPPQPTTKAGLFELKVMDTRNSNTFIVLVTRRDLNKICEAMNENKPFMFVKKHGDWAEVIVGEFQK